MKSIILTFAVFLYFNVINSQTPANDASWILVPNNSDEFNGSLSSIWLGGPNHPEPDWRSAFTQTYLENICAEYPFRAFRTNNNRTFVNNQSFRMITKFHTSAITVNTLTDGCCCVDNNCGGEWCENGSGIPVCSTCGGQTKNFLYSTSPWLLSINAIKYGFFEASLRCKDVGSNNHRGFGANFWLTGSGVTRNFDDMGNEINIIPTYSEIDALEFVSWDSNYSTSNHMYTLNNHFELNNISRTDGTQFKGNISFANGVYHKFAVEWTPTYIKYYLDDYLKHVSVNNPSLMLPLRVVLDMNTFTTGSVDLQPNGQTIPGVIDSIYTFDIDYIKVYKLRQDLANTAWAGCNPYSMPQKSLYKSISIGANGCNPFTLNANQILVLRAVDFIEISSSTSSSFYFSAAQGSNIYLETMPNHVQTIIPVISN